MLPAQRLAQIRKLIQSHHSLKITDLSNMFNVSEMTIHRDIKVLVEEGIAAKTFGGITLISKEVEQETNRDDCVFCHRQINPRLAYRLILPNNRIESTCCCHCGLLRHRQLGDQVIQALCYDFFLQTTISAPLAWYVMNTSVDVRCCQPQALAFENLEHASGFIKGFGGTVLSFPQSLEQVHISMGNEPRTCCKKEKI